MLLTTLFGLGLLAAAAPQVPVTPPPTAVPHFVANVGQWDAEVRFAALRGDGAACIGDGAFWVVARNSDGIRSIVRLTFERATPCIPRPEDRQHGVFHFLLGEDRAAWHTDVPSFDRIRYPEPVPGLDVVLRDDSGTLHYDLELRPGADLDALRIRVDGGTVRIDDSGGLRILTPIGELVQPPPVTWGIGDDGQRRALLSRFVSRGEQVFGFEVPDRDAACSTVIDPALIWATYLGGSSIDDVLAVDQLGSDAYAAGRTRSADLPTSATAYDRTFAGTSTTYDMFVARFRTTSSGSAQMIYCTYVGGTGIAEVPQDLFVDSTGSATVGGVINGSGIPASSFAFQPAFHRNRSATDGFVLQLSPTGSSVNWATYVGGLSSDEVQGVHLDVASNSLTIVGRTLSSDFPTSPFAVDETFNGNWDAFVLRLDAAGSRLSWSTFLGGADQDAARAVDVLPDGSTIVGGMTMSPTYPTTPGAFQTTLRAASMAGFVTRVASNGRSLVASTLLDSTSDVLRGIEILALDAETDGHVWVGGTTRTPYFPYLTLYSFDVGYSGNSEGFVSRFDPLLSRLTMSSLCGGLGDEQVRGIAWDGADSAAVGGWTTAGDFPTTPGCFDASHNGGVDGFALRVTNAGRLLYSSYYGGSADDTVNDATILSDGATLLGGGTSSTNLPTSNPFDPSANGGGDGFLAIVDTRRSRTWPTGYEYATGPSSVAAPFSAPDGQSSRLLVLMKSSGIPWGPSSQIDAVTFRKALQVGAIAGPGTLRIRMGTTSRIPEQISLRFDDNFSSTPRTVFQGNVDLSSTSASAVLRVPFATPFPCVANTNLVIDLLFTPNRPRSGTDWTIEAHSQSHGARAGLVQIYGRGCAGSNGVIPTAAAIAATTVPGAELTVMTEGSIRPTSASEQVAISLLGASNTQLNGGPLPINLGLIGCSPSCYLRTDIIDSQNVTMLAATATTSRGYATWLLPPLTSWAGLTVFSQWLFWDLRVSSPTKWVMSDAAGITFGTMPFTLMGGQSVWKIGGADGSATEVGTRGLDSVRPILDFEGQWR